LRPKLTRYEVLGRLATGGMAEVWLARATGASGFEKKVVLKTILPALATNEQFTAMFINEAKVAALLNHPNCVQIFDLGHEGGTYFIAMEFIEGFSFSRILRRVELKGERVPVPVVARIIMDACSGLEYAHKLTDSAGAPMGLVHRDISPDNLLVSFSGQTKLVDFGIAKAATMEGAPTTTRSGTMKGKYGYMAPEYLKGQPADARSDLFAVGVVLYRALTAQKPFTGATEVMVSKAVLDLTPTKPSAIDPRLTPALDAVVMRTLEKEPEARFESAKELRAALSAAAGKVADAEEVAAYLDGLIPPTDPERSALGDLASNRREDTSDPVLSQVISVEVELSRLTQSKVTRNVTPSSLEPARRSPPIGVIAGVAGVVVALGLAVALLRKPAPPPEPVTPPTPVAVKPAEPVPVPAPVKPQEPAPEPAPPEPTAAAGTPEPSATPEPAKAGKHTARFELSTEPKVKVYWHGKLLGSAPGAFELALGKQTLRLSEPSLGIEKSLTVVVGAHNPAKAITFAKASLEVRAAPWANVKLDGKAMGQTPVKTDDVYEGDHVLELSNPELNQTRRIEVKLAPGEHKTVRESLE
jgi:serine/threonine-protein kinase